MAKRGPAHIYLALALYTVTHKSATGRDINVFDLEVL
jgi:hypothetical protein